jgi:hypothetical protein
MEGLKEMSKIKLNIEIEIPDGEYCNGCNYEVRHCPSYSCYNNMCCMLYGKATLTHEKGKGFKKCKRCLENGG